MRAARATACSNIALVKYWGKRPSPTPDLNLPAVGSLSMTLDGLATRTDVRPAQTDAFILNDRAARPEQAARVFAHLDRVWGEGSDGGSRPSCQVESGNSFPTAAGLASSASGFAALTMAAAAAFEMPLAPRRLSGLARRGSGSAARSLWGGFVRQDRGERPDGSDCRAYQLFVAAHWDVRMLVVHTAVGEKPVGSTGGMERSRQTSPYYQAWVDSSEADLARAQDALTRRSLRDLGEVMEHSCFKMHAAMLATRPPLMYWNGATIEVIRAVWDAREGGLEAYVTSDAGPHVKVLCAAETAAALGDRLRGVAGVQDVVAASPGPDASAEVLE